MKRAQRQVLPSKSPGDTLGVSGISENCAPICVISTGLGGTLSVEVLVFCPYSRVEEVVWAARGSLTSVIEEVPYWLCCRLA